MSEKFYYISAGKLYLHSNGKDSEITSGVLDSYLAKVRDSANRNEWKYTGDGAAFRGAYVAGADAESRVSSVSSRTLCVGVYKDGFIYSLAIDRTTGVYRRSADSDREGIVISSSDTAYSDFDIDGDRMVVTSAFAGESHIGVLNIGDTACKIYTEGHTWDSHPVWSATDRNKIYFCCSGLPIRDDGDARTPQAANYAQMIAQMFARAQSSVERGPSSICLLDISHGSLDELLSDDKYDYTYPQSTPDGALYYIRRPYSDNNGGSNGLGCLADLVMMPFRLIRALFGFLNVFSAKYSGKTLSKNVGVKNKDEGQIFIDGNLINAEAELKANCGDKNPGIIPHSWELRKLAPGGEDKLIRRGVAAYRVEKESGSILVSNGSAILRISPDGKEEKLCGASQVTFIS